MLDIKLDNCSRGIAHVINPQGKLEVDLYRLASAVERANYSRWVKFDQDQTLTQSFLPT